MSSDYVQSGTGGAGSPSIPGGHGRPGWRVIFQTLSQKTLSEVSVLSDNSGGMGGGDSRGHGRPEWRVNFQTLSQKTLSEVSVLSDNSGGMGGGIPGGMGSPSGGSISDTFAKDPLGGL